MRAPRSTAMLVFGVLALCCYTTALVGDLSRGFAPGLHRHASAFSGAGSVCLIILVCMRWRAYRAQRQAETAPHL